MHKAVEVMIGGGAGFANDRKDSTGPLIDALSRHEGPRFMIFEMLAERTLALAQNEKRRSPDRGFIAAIEPMLRSNLAACVKAGIKIIGNFGAANPHAAAIHVATWAKEAGFPDIRIACVEGDDLIGKLSTNFLADAEVDGQVLRSNPQILAINAYLGAASIARALDIGADVVITGRVADPALALGPLWHVFQWAEDDWDSLAAGVLAGHLLECGPQVTGGYFADPGFNDVSNMDMIGYPLASISRDGTIVLTKPEGTGGLIDLRTVKEQILYEIHDPAAYLTPDVVLDLSQVELTQMGPDRVRVTGARGKMRPDRLKATVCIDGGYLTEAEISYAGVNAEARARLAIDIIRARMARVSANLLIRADIIGLVSVFGDTGGQALAARKTTDLSPDLRVMFATEVGSPEEGRILIDEVEALYVSGPAGGGGVRSRLLPRLKSTSCLLPRELVEPKVSLIGAQ
ncbi:acyclic terpene utilization AtuA family protein [Phyllobacterium sp. K27]